MNFNSSRWLGQSPSRMKRQRVLVKLNYTLCVSLASPPTVLISLILLLLLLLLTFFSISFHFTLPPLPYFTHTLQLPYFLQRLPLDSSKLYVCVLTLVAPSTCKWLWYLMFEEKRWRKKIPKCKIKQIRGRNFHFAVECVSWHALPFMFSFQSSQGQLVLEVF